MTAHALAGRREVFIAAGIDAYFAKPLRLADLTALLGRLAELRRSRAI